MNIQELYVLIGGNYERAVQIMKKDKMIEKYLIKLTESGLYEGFAEAAKTFDPVQLFERAHAMKGVCANLGLDALAGAAGDVTEEFRPGRERAHSDDEVRAMIQKVDGLYLRAAGGIKAYEASLN